jgi:hypothetical protein
LYAKGVLLAKPRVARLGELPWVQMYIFFNPEGVVKAYAKWSLSSTFPAITTPSGLENYYRPAPWVARRLATQGYENTTPTAYRKRDGVHTARYISRRLDISQKVLDLRLIGKTLQVISL